MLDTIISCYKNALSTTAIPVGLRAFLRAERTKNAVLAIRSESDKARRNEMKKLLPGATISGLFRHRSIAGIQQYNGLLCMDFDGPDNPDHAPEAIKHTLKQFPEVAYAGLSVSGTGVFAIIPTNNDDPAQHPRIVDFMRSVFFEAGLLIDVACKDVCRLRFVSYDPDAWFNPAPVVFDAKRFLEQHRAMQRQNLRHGATKAQAGSIGDKVDRYVSAIEAGCNDVTAVYSDWVNIGFALASEFGMNGERYYQRISQFHPKYDHLQTEKKYLELCRNGGNRVRIGTFFRICHLNGIKP